MMFMLQRLVFRHFRTAPSSFLAAIGWRNRRHAARHDFMIPTLRESLCPDNARLREKLPMMIPWDRPEYENISTMQMRPCE